MTFVSDFFFSSRRRHTRLVSDWSSDVCSSDLAGVARTPSDWMLQYFRHARTLNRQLLRYLEQKAPVPLTLRQRLINAARPSRIEAGDGKYFQVRDGLLEVMDLSALSDRAITYSLFAE